MAADGWRKVLQNHRDATITRFVGTLNTPKPAQIDELFSSLLGLDSVSKAWGWQKNSMNESRDKLERYVTLRGAIAHRVQAAASVTKTQAEDYRHFVSQLAIKTANRVRDHLLSLGTPFPWDSIPF